ncbi:PQQ-dependent sugar dehydrogenase [Stutzerimonas azotifigens]|uniref:PQQ-dependent sugar dehydrogenase n=1 Tax=Stutzerimonas azotifigens TaxID=291995 RepID=A0ABR5YZ68_9GAMM|nr:PQQ-dependent sugar dehydrogenase [Stutzerimonas azotifigens]
MLRSRRLASLLCATALLVGGPAHAVDYRIETLAEGLQYPWSLAFLPDGRMLVTERVGRLRLIEADGTLQEQPVAGTPSGYQDVQAGLMDVALDPDFDKTPWVYLTYAYGREQANNTRLARGRLVDGRLEDVQTLFSAYPTKAGGSHFGGRIAFLPDKTLVLTLGDGFDYREEAQNLDNHLGKLVRLTREGTAPEDNPFYGRTGMANEVYSYGHRNVQGIAYDRQNQRLYINEHGPRGGDEINLIQAGRNYGWPLASFGVDYTGAQITPYQNLPDTEPPLLHWTPSIAPSALAIYDGTLFPDWQGDLFSAALVAKQVRRVRLADGEVVEQEALFEELDERIRDVRVGPDGALYLLTDSAEGRLLKITPAEQPESE